MAIIGTAAQVQQSLYVNLDYRLRPDGTLFVTPDRDPSLDLNVPILRVTGLGDYASPQHLALNGTGNGKTLSRHRPAQCLSGGGFYLSDL